MNIICQRILEYTHSDGSEKEITIQVGKPFEDTKPGGDWACTFSISGLGETIEKTMYGIDSLQALMHSIKGMEANLIYLQRTQKVSITWFGMDNWGIMLQEK